MNRESRYIRILSIDPCSKGFGFTVLETHPRLVDWGVARVWGSSKMEFLVRVDGLIERYRPHAVVLEELGAVRRSPRTRERLAATEAHVRHRELAVLLVSRATAQLALVGDGSTKRAIALRLAEMFPELRPHLPPPRKPWMTEDERMSIFDAAALAVASVATA